MIIVTGKTGSGKSTIVKELMKYGFHQIITTTSRPKREKEIQDVDYHFVSEDEFMNKVDQNYFAEYKAYDTGFGIWRYGLSKEDMENSTDKDIVILTPEGYKDVIRAYPNLEHRLIYIFANNQTIKNRLSKRGDKKEEAERRLKQDYEDFKGVENLAHRIVYNNDSDELHNVIKKITNYLEVND